MDEPLKSLRDAVSILYMIFATIVICLALFGSISLLIGADRREPNDPEVVLEASESLQSPILEPEMMDFYLNPINALPASKKEEEIIDAPEQEARAVNTLHGVRITHYCSCEKCCGSYSGGPTKSGRLPAAGRTAAANPVFIRQGSVVSINGRDYVVEDTGPRNGVIDIYVNGHEEALKLGTYITDVEVKRYGW